MILKETYYIRRLKVVGLFGKEHEAVLDFHEGVNCLYGANGSGKTTLINLLVAALSCDIDKFIASRCENLTVYLAKTGQKRPIRFFYVEKTRDEKNKYNGLSYDIADQFVEGRLDSSIPNGQTRRIIKETLAVNYLPLYRHNESESYDEIRKEERYPRNPGNIWSGDPADLNHVIDPLRKVLFGLERRFKDEFSKKQREIREDLELLKNKVLEKLLIDDALVMKARESAPQKRDIKSDDYKKAQQKLDDIGLRLPASKLEKHFAAMINATQDLFAKRDEYIALSKKNADQETLNKVLTEHSSVLKVYRALDTIHNRFVSILSDVEKSTEYRVAALRDFKQFEDMINSFLSNKRFEFTDVGGFRFNCRGVEIKPEDLSSGEKHILALLGKIALSSQDRDVFIADEPELSLHLAWQRKLLPSLRKLAPSMQIIVATHAPAIIPPKANKIDLDELNYGATTI